MAVIKLNLEDLHFALNIKKELGEVSYTINVEEFHDDTLFIDGTLIIEDQTIELEFDGYTISTVANLSVKSNCGFHHIDVFDVDDEFILNEINEVLELSNYWEE